uniref:Expressed protein n=1 Tax=Echinococcus granulosus TaxID=6210 RepID=A0A068WWF2_ECHGR|nr:expressed protein [Echinococcus granulosus]
MLRLHTVAQICPLDVMQLDTIWVEEVLHLRSTERLTPLSHCKILFSKTPQITLADGRMIITTSFSRQILSPFLFTLYSSFA